jgi:hypothetical protein
MKICVKKHIVGAALFLILTALSLGAATFGNGPYLRGPADGTILVVTSSVASTPTGTNGPAGIVAVDPNNGQQSFLSQGGLFYFPTDIREGADDTLYVADAGYAGSGPVPAAGSLTALGGVYGVNSSSGLQTLIVSDPGVPNPMGLEIIRNHLIVVGSTFFADGLTPGSYAYVADIDPRTGHWHIITDTTSSSNLLVSPVAVQPGPDNSVYVSDPGAGAGGLGGILQVDLESGAQTLIASVGGAARMGAGSNGNLVVTVCPSFTCAASSVVNINTKATPPTQTTLVTVPQPLGGITANSRWDVYLTANAGLAVPPAIFKLSPQSVLGVVPITTGGSLGLFSGDNIVFHHNRDVRCIE